MTLFERSSQPRPTGSGLLLQPPALCVLDALGLLEAAMAKGARIARLEGRTRGGRSIMDLTYSQWAPEAFGLGMHRGALWQILFNAVEARRIPVVAGAALASVSRTPQGARLAFDRGDEAGPFDLLLIATGSRTPLRSALRVEDSTRPYAWGALWATAPLPAGWPADALVQRYQGTGRMMGVLPVGRDASGAGPWATVFWSERVDRFAGLRERGWKPFLQDIGQLWPDAVDLVSPLGGLEAFSDAVYADVRVTRWCDGCVALIGDAAHGTSPQLGQGASLALLDAQSLARALRTAPSVEVALRRHERERRPHVDYYQWASRMLTPFFQSEQRALGWLRDLAMGPAGKLPVARGEFLATLTGHKTGLAFGRLESPDPPARP